MSWKGTHGDPCREQEFMRRNVLIPCSTYCHRAPVYFPPCKEQIHLGEVSKFELWYQGTRWRLEPKLSGASRNARLPRVSGFGWGPGVQNGEGGCSFKTGPESPVFIGCTVLLRLSVRSSSKRALSWNEGKHLETHLSDGDFHVWGKLNPK